MTMSISHDISTFALTVMHMGRLDGKKWVYKHRVLCCYFTLPKSDIFTPMFLWAYQSPDGQTCW